MRRCENERKYENNPILGDLDNFYNRATDLSWKFN